MHSLHEDFAAAHVNGILLVQTVSFCWLTQYPAEELECSISAEGKHLFAGRRF
jgi:hypothetical protein